MTETVPEKVTEPCSGDNRAGLGIHFMSLGAGMDLGQRLPLRSQHNLIDLFKFGLPAASSAGRREG